jgi:endo-1,4-beta-mannosidase
MLNTVCNSQGLDFVISEARKYIIRLILTLSNNYHDFEGRPQYVNWVRAAGVPVNNDDDFYLYKRCCEGLFLFLFITRTMSSFIF